MINGKNGHGTHSTKMGADKLVKNTPNAPKSIYPNCPPSWKVWDFDEKRLFGASIVHAQKKKYSNLQVDRSLVFSPDQCQYYPKDNPAFSSPKWVKQQHTMQWFEKVSEEFNLFSGENGCGKIKNAPSKIFYPIA